MTIQQIFSLVIGITFTRFLMSCPSGKMEAENGSCIDCPAGHSGKNCSDICDYTTYGVGCRKVCRCSSAEYCDHRVGCIQLSTTTTNVRDVTTGNLQQDLRRSSVQTGILSFDLLIIIVGSVGCNLLLTVVILCSFIIFIWKWKQDKQRCQSGNVADVSSNKSHSLEASKDLQGEIIELHADNYEPPIIPTERPMDNVYTGIIIV